MRLLLTVFIILSYSIIANSNGFVSGSNLQYSTVDSIPVAIFNPLLDNPIDDCDRILDGSCDSDLTKYEQPYDAANGRYDDCSSIPEHVCTRNCIKGDPKICYYKFVLEYYSTMSDNCGNCSNTSSDCLAKDCVPADGRERSILTINRMMPGPPIIVCEGDKIIVDVVNAMAGSSTTIHWHGLKQNESQYMDGVPMVTQCPILEGQTFRYCFRALDVGVHFYHSHDGLQKADGIVGALVIKKEKSNDPNQGLYDYDLASHCILVQDWYHLTSTELYPGRTDNDLYQMAQTYLIGGRGWWYFTNGTRMVDVPLSMYNVTHGYRYVLSIIAGTCYECQYVVKVKSHKLTIIGSDGKPTKPYVVDSLTMAAGERYRCVLHANQTVDTYWIKVWTVGYCASYQRNAYQLAYLRYEGHNGTPSAAEPNYTTCITEGPGITMSPVNSNCTEETKETNGPCIADLRSPYNSSENIVKKKADYRVFMVTGFYLYTDNKPTTANSSNPKFLRTPDVTVCSGINGICYANSPSPLLSQWDDIPEGTICPSDGYPIDTWYSKLRQCTHVIHLPYNATCEIVYMDYATWTPDGISHPMHLHGYDPSVVEMGICPEADSVSEAVANMNAYLDSDERKEIPKNPATKDTVAVIAGGYVCMRIHTLNPGCWYFHCHFAYHLESGMSCVMKVGNKTHLPPAPKDFPKCGNFLPFCEFCNKY